MQLHVRPVWKQDRFYCSYQDQQPGADHLLLLKECSQNAVLDWTGYHGSEETQGTVPVLSVYVTKESGYGFLGIQADLRGEKPVRYRERRIFLIQSLLRQHGGAWSQQ